MALVNNVTLSGYVATEPKAFGKDLSVGRLRIRFDKSRKVGEEWTKEANFFSVVVFGTDVVSRFLELKQGDKIVVTGRLQQTEQEKEGKKREFVDIVATEFAFIPTDNDVNKGQVEGKAVPASQESQDFLDVS